MANEFLIPYPTSGLSTVYAVMHQGANIVNASTGALITRSSGNWATGKIAASDAAAATNYLASVPANTPAGGYTVVAYIQAAGSPALTDTVIGSSPTPFMWNGTAEVFLTNIVDANNRVNVGKWLDQAALLDANNLPKVDVQDWEGAVANALSSGNVQVFVAGMSSGVITSSTFAAGAINSTVAPGLALPVLGGTVNDTSPQATQFVVSAASLLLGSSKPWVDRVVYFTTGALAGLYCHISKFDTTTHRLTVLVGFPAAPANGDQFILIGLMK